MNAITDWIVGFLSDSIAQVLFTLLALIVVPTLFHYLVFRRIREQVGESFKWYAIMLRTLELRLRYIDEHLMVNPQGHAGDMTLRRLLRKGLADVEAVEVAGGAVPGSLDLPLVSPKQAMLLARFEASRARLLSELNRAMQIVDAGFDLDDIGDDFRYLWFLRGGASPVSQGLCGKQRAEQDRHVRSLLQRHLEDCVQLSAAFMRIEEEEAKVLFEGSTYWDNWTGWIPSVGGTRRTGES